MSCDYYEDEGYSEPTTDHEVTLNAEVSVRWSNKAVLKQVIDKVANRIYDDLKPQTEKAILATLNDQVNQSIADVLDREIQLTDRWGAPTGDKMSIRSMLQRDTEEWLTEVVDSRGRKGTDAYGAKHHRIHWVVEAALGHKDRLGETSLQKMVIEAAKATIGDVQAVVEGEVRKQARAALGLD